MGLWKSTYLDKKDSEPSYNGDARARLRRCRGVMDREGKCENTFMSVAGIYCDECHKYFNSGEWRKFFPKAIKQMKKIDPVAKEQILILVQEARNSLFWPDTDLNDKEICQYVDQARHRLDKVAHIFAKERAAGQACLNFTPEQDRLAVDALKMIRTVEETLHQARHEINMERPTTAVQRLNEARHELTLAVETVRAITRIT